MFNIFLSSAWVKVKPKLLKKKKYNKWLKTRQIKLLITLNHNIPRLYFCLFANYLAIWILRLQCIDCLLSVGLFWGLFSTKVSPVASLVLQWQFSSEFLFWLELSAGTTHTQRGPVAFQKADKRLCFNWSSPFWHQSWLL